MFPLQTFLQLEIFAIHHKNFIWNTNLIKVCVNWINIRQKVIKGETFNYITTIYMTTIHIYIYIYIYLVGRGALPPDFIKTLPPITYPLFFKVCPTPPTLLPPTPTPAAHSVVSFLWLNGWSHHIWCVILLNDLMNLHMSSLRTWVRVLCNKGSSFIVCIRVSTPLLPTSKTPPLFSPSLALNLYWFFVNVPIKIRFFRETP